MPHAGAAVAAVIAVLAVGLVVLPGVVSDDGPGSRAPVQAPPVESSPELSAEEREGLAATLAAIEADDLPYSQDGTTFQNREGRLPQRPLGHYREYTVETPGLSHRGARRLVIGDDGETYYTADHYDSFTRIDPEAFR